MSDAVREEIRQALGVAVLELRPLHGGSVGEVYRASLEDGRSVVAKVDRSNQPALDVEGYMLEYLAANSNLPVPAVYSYSPGLLLMERVDGDSSFSRLAQEHAAELLAELHGVTADAFGLERDTLIGSLHQPNTRETEWVRFFRAHRLLFMAREAHASGRIDGALFKRIEAFADALANWLHEPKAPSLLHGDVWTTNVLADTKRVTAFIDPAIYFGHPEIELAFITLFGTFGKAFFDRYGALRGIETGFFEERKDIYNLYPLLVHVRLFGGGYVGSVDDTLRRFGF